MKSTSLQVSSNSFFFLKENTRDENRLGNGLVEVNLELNLLPFFLCGLSKLSEWGGEERMIE